MFGAAREQLVGQSFKVLYPSDAEYERIGFRMIPILNASGVYSDDRIMKRMGGRFQGETFWCHVTGRTLNPNPQSGNLIPAARGACGAPRRRAGRPWSKGQA